MTSQEEIERQAYEQIGRLVVNELQANGPFAREFYRRSIGDKVLRVVKTYIVLDEVRKQPKKTWFKRIIERFRKWNNQDVDELIEHA